MTSEMSDEREKFWAAGVCAEVKKHLYFTQKYTVIDLAYWCMF